MRRNVEKYEEQRNYDSRKEEFIKSMQGEIDKSSRRTTAFIKQELARIKEKTANFIKNDKL